MWANVSFKFIFLQLHAKITTVEDGRSQYVTILFVDGYFWNTTHDRSLYLLTERYLESIRHYLETRPPPLNLNVLDQVCCVLIRITSCSLNFLIKPCRDYWSHLYWSWRYLCCCPGFCLNFGHTRDRSWACKGMASSSHKVHSYWHGYTSRVLHHVLTGVRQPWCSWRFMWRILLGKLHPLACTVNIRV